MPKEKTPETGAAPTVDPVANPDVKITPELLAVLENMVNARVQNNSQQTLSSDGFSVYGARDPKSIESVNVKRIFGKFVVKFKDIQNDPIKIAKGIPKYVSYQLDPNRKLANQPYITLVLSNDGVEFEEKEVPLVDYYNEREYFEAPIKDIKIEKYIVQNGRLGSGGGLAREVDDKGNPVIRSNVKAEVAMEKRVFYVELPGFKELVAFNDDPIGPLS